jgi:hypothetical protein
VSETLRLALRAPHFYPKNKLLVISTYLNFKKFGLKIPDLRLRRLRFCPSAKVKMPQKILWGFFISFFKSHSQALVTGKLPMFLTYLIDIAIMMYKLIHHAIMGVFYMLRTQIQIEEDQIKWLRDRAKERGVSVSQLIREGVDFYRKYEDRIPEDKKKKALAAIGRYASGVSDISEKHDDYLAEAFKAG